MMPNFSKTWWTPVWRGLVVDPEAKHYRRLKSAVWLLLYLFIHAERQTGSVHIRLSTIAASMAVPSRTVQRWMATLREYGYVARRGDKGDRLYILKWKRMMRATTTAPVDAKYGAPGRQA